MGGGGGTRGWGEEVERWREGVGGSVKIGGWGKAMARDRASSIRIFRKPKMRCKKAKKA